MMYAGLAFTGLISLPYLIRQIVVSIKLDKMGW